MRRRQVSRTQVTSSARRFTNSGPVLPFNPASITGCRLWLDAADTSSILMNSSSNVSLWIDKSGNGFHATAGGTTPTYSSATRSIVFGGAGYFTNSSLSLPLSTRSVFIVCKQTSRAADFEGIMLLSSPLDSDMDYDSATTIPYFASGSNVVVGDTAFSIYNRGTYVQNYRPYVLTPLGIYEDIFGSSSGTLYINGTSNSTVADSSGLGTANGYILGARKFSGTTLSTFLNGVIYEILVYNTALTTNQRQKVEGYLAHKWDLKSSLPSNHPYKSAAPTYEEPIFVPTLISGSQLWLDGMDSTTITGTTSVTQWRDKSGNSRHLGVGSGTTSYSSSAINLNSSYMYVNSPVNLINVTVFILSKSTGVTNQTILGAKPNTDYVYNSVDGFGFYKDPPTGRIRFYGQGNDSMQSIFFTDTSTYKLYSFQSTGTTVSGWLNGISQSGGTLTTTRTSTAQGFAIGAEWGGTSYVNIWVTASIYEILVYNTDLTQAQRKRVEGYLAQKWGLQSSLPANHPYKTIAPIGIPRSITIQSVSAFFNTGTNTCLTIPANSVLTLGTNNHTIEFWMYQVSRGQYDVPFAYGKMTPQTATTNYYMNSGSQGFGVAIGNGSGGWAVQLTGTIFSLNAWHHYAIVRNGTTFTFYVNGTSIASTTSSISIPAQGDVFRVGSDGEGYGLTNSYISNFRLVNGTAVYTSNFTPPTSPLTAIPNTQILIQGLVDRSPNAFTVTNNGSVALSTSVSPFV